MPDPDASNAPLVTISEVGHAATVLHLPDGHAPEPWDAVCELLADDVPKEEALGPLRRVLDVARRHRCRTVVIEEHYLDPDYRSEYAAFWSKRFEDRPRVARRLHFFTAELVGGQVWDIPATVADSYIGYSVLRPTVLGPVGRTVLAPPPELDGATLCQVHDRPSLFGNALEVTGVAFCQQDGELLICAHTAAWLCHYVAHDRGITGRRNTAQIVAMPSPEASRLRPVPSNGLTAEQLQGLFSALDIPAFFDEIDHLPDLPALPPAPPEGASDEEVAAHEELVRREEIVRVACKYLNSGFPVLVLTGGADAHAFTLVGWRQEGEEVVLIACDDQVGPYEEIADLTADLQERGPWKSLMVPLPEKVFLTGEAAEAAARGLVDWVATEYAERDDLDVDDPRANDLSRIWEVLGQWRGPISVRTRLIEGRRYKALLSRQERSPDVLRLLRLTRLPHWVWVVEFHDRAAREAGEPCVLAEVVLDSTSHDDAPMVDIVATTSTAVDAGLERERPDDPAATAKGDGQMWRSMISDPDLIDDEYRTAPQTPGDARHAA